MILRSPLIMDSQLALEEATLALCALLAPQFGHAHWYRAHSSYYTVHNDTVHTPNRNACSIIFSPDPIISTPALHVVPPVFQCAPMPCAYASDLLTGRMRWMARRGCRVPPQLPVQPESDSIQQLVQTDSDGFPQQVHLALDTVKINPPTSSWSAADQAALLAHNAYHEDLINEVSLARLDGKPGDNPVLSVLLEH